MMMHLTVGGCQCTLVVAPWNGRDGHSSITLRDQIYVMGGTSDVMCNYNDVWSSPDGKLWTRICHEANWCGRWMQAAVEHNGALYIMGGWAEEGMLNDVWRSEDGVEWVQVISGKQQHFYSVVVILNSIVPVAAVESCYTSLTFLHCCTFLK